MGPFEDNQVIRVEFLREGITRKNILTGNELGWHLDLGLPRTVRNKFLLLKQWYFFFKQPISLRQWVYQLHLPSVSLGRKRLTDDI
jgi:hypothetical protein